MDKPSLLQRAVALLILAVTFLGGWYGLDYKSSLNRNIAVSAVGAVFEIAPGQSLRAIASQLEQAGIIKDPLYLVFYARWNALGGKVKAGEYLLTSDLTLVSLIDLFVQGKVIQYNLTLVEGWNIHQLLAAMHADTGLVNVLGDVPLDKIMEKISGASVHPEGQFLPDTYQFTKGNRDIDILKRAFHLKETYLQQEWDKRAQGLPLKDPYEALILASIVEKETAKKEEYAQVAGVFVRRLQQGMLLQTDPTVIYGMGSEYDGNIRRKDLEQDTPYNSYVHAGLPPTPIAMPGRSAIHAALHPDDTDALYFVATGDGGHHFSATLKEHINAVRKYQRKK